MRREELFGALRNVSAAFDDSGATKLFDARLLPESRQDKNTTAESLEVFRRFESYRRSFGAAEHQILQIFGLAIAEKVSFWTEVIIPSQGRTTQVRHFAYNLAQFRDFAPKVLTMLENDAIRVKRQGTDSEERSSQVLTIILIEEKGQASKPERVVASIESVVGLYSVIVTVRGLSPDSLSIIGCDSGSDKSFDFLGLPDAIVAVKELILELWDRAVFFRQTKTEHNLSVALRSLAVVDEISRMEQQGSLGPEDAERLRHQAVVNASQFLSCGIVIPEIEHHTTYNPRVLMSPQPKLISGSVAMASADPGLSSGGSPQPPEVVASAATNLTAEEEQLLRKLLERSRGEEPAEETET